MLILVKSAWHWLRVFIYKCTHVCRWVKTVNRVFGPNVNIAMHLQSLFRDADWHKFASDILNRGKYPSVQVPNIVKDFLLSFSHRLWILLAIRNRPKPYYSFWATAAVWLWDSEERPWSKESQTAGLLCTNICGFPKTFFFTFSLNTAQINF